MRLKIVPAVLAALAASRLPASAAEEEPPTPRIVVTGEVLHPVDDRLFGQFMEIASWGEPGPDTLADPETGDLPTEIVDALRELHAPIVRFPGGIDVSYVDWTDRVDLPAPGDADAPRGVPTREGARPTLKDSGYPNRFGYDEFFRLVDDLGTEALIVLKLHETLRGDSTVEEGAREAAGLVAYLNAEVGAELPAGMPDWPALRAANGHPEPQGVKVFQVGNEIWNDGAEVLAAAAERTGESENAFLVRCLVAFGEAIHAVDPSVELICDSHFRKGWWRADGEETAEKIPSFPVLDDPGVQEHYRHVATHLYAPWNVKSLTVGGKDTDSAELTPEAAYLATVGVPGEASARRVDGRWSPPEAEAEPRKQELAEVTGHRLAYTEWNWNGWGKQMPGGQAPGSRVYAASRAGGAASYLHGIMRAGGVASIGTQSMMLAQNWFIGAVRIQETPGSGGEKVPVVTPSGRATAPYAQHHGDRRLAADWSVDPDEVRQDVRMGSATSMDPMPRFDVVVTADDDAYFVHVIHRRWQGGGSLELELPEDAAAEGTRFQVVPVDGGDGVYVATKREVAIADTARLELPPASVSVTVIPRNR